MTYNLQGDLLTTKNALGQVTTTIYSTSGLLQTVTDPLLHTVTYEYCNPVVPTCPSNRLVSDVIDAIGNRTTYTYDLTASATASTTQHPLPNPPTPNHDRPLHL